MEHDPSDICRFNGTAIAYVPTRTATGDVQLNIVDDVDAVRSWLEFRYVDRLVTSFGTAAAHSARADIPAHYPTSVTVGEHELSFVIGPEDPYPQPWVGQTLTLDPGWWYPDLTEVSLNWPWSDWNDQVSYIGTSRSACAFWEHIDAQGSVLLAGSFNGGHWLPYLTTIGWNDRISSFANYG